ncbi:PREDICTED: uncharacterized protein LOC104613381 [Nelumbo nucifera]|uniref:Uncharacterized protein LOC104613381 n=1 Tax=Nelumbo nucifera TaxID=4432 RepID=A0A1U8BDA1_NELNU|nr:PREDICTED: uncharacterized protein LOC104613381 [Nelumbo nucifera]
MGKPVGKKKNQVGGKSGGANVKHDKSGEPNPKTFDKDTDVFIAMSQELKDEGNKLFQKRDPEGAMLKYEKALKLLPRNHIDVAYLRSNMAACYMQMGLGEYPRAINECNLALEVSPKYSKALLRRAKCYESLNRLDLAFRDVRTVLNTEPNNLAALETYERVKSMLEIKGVKVEDTDITLSPECTDPPSGSPPSRLIKEKRKKKSSKIEEKKAEDKVVVEEKVSNPEKEEKEAKRTVKLVFGEDIRWANVPVNCTILQVREVIQNRFPSLNAVLIKYKDQEGDLVTITTTEELRWAETSAEPQGSLRLYIVEVNLEMEPLLDGVKYVPVVHEIEKNEQSIIENGNAGQSGEIREGSSYIDDWIFQFALLFKNHVGFTSDEYLDLHELGMKLYSEALEDTLTSEEAQDVFNIAAEKFQEMSALALFNWGNVHMSRARKRVFFTEDASIESVLAQVKDAYDWAQKEYLKAGKRYEESLKIKPDFYEGFLGLAQQQFEQAKLSWYYAIGNKVDLNAWPSSEVIELYNNSEENMEKGIQMWEQTEVKRLTEYSKTNKLKEKLQKEGLDGLFKDISAEEAAEQSANMRSQIHLLWGTMLYERSLVEFKLGLPGWEECLEVAVEKFELAGASSTDIAVMIKNHCSNQTASQGLGFKIDEIVQAWNEMYDAKRWQSNIPSFRLEPLFRRKVPKLHHVLENS